MLKKILVACLVLLSPALSVSQVIHQTAILDLPNNFTSSNSFSQGIFSGPVTFSQLGSLIGLTNFVYVTDGTLGSNPCTGGGTGAFAQRIGAVWNCNTASSSVSLPILNVATFGATGNGITDDTSSIQSAVNACPQTAPTVGCYIWFPAGTYKTSNTINLALLQGVHVLGVGMCGINTCSVLLQTNGAYYGWTVGTGSSPNTSGFSFDGVGCQDMTGTGLGCFDIKATNSGNIWNATSVNYVTGAGIELDGGVNFTQFIDIHNYNFWHNKFGIQTTSKTASIFVWGGQGNCVNAGVTDVIAGSIGIDIGFTNHPSGTGTGSEWSVDYQTQNCQDGVMIWNGGGNHFWGKAVENTFILRPNNSIGVGVFGDASCGGSCSFLANGNTFDGVQITGAGTGFFVSPNTANTAIIAPIFNGTNGVDLNIDSSVLAATRLITNKRWTGTQTNITSISRSGNVVTAVTAANAALSLQAQNLITVSGVTSTTNNFNGTFPLNANASTVDSTGVTTLTWNQTGATESGTTNAGGCQGAGSCVLAISTVQVASVGTYELTGDNVTQDTVEQSPTLAFGQSNFPGVIGVPGAWQHVFDGVHEIFNENQNGPLHLQGGNTVTFGGGTGGSYTPQPMTVLTGVNDSVNTTSGASVTVTLPAGGGKVFLTSWVGASVVINSTWSCTISAVASQTSLTASSCNPSIPSPQTGVSFNTSGIPGVPPCSTLLNGSLCPSADDKNYIVTTNSTTVCLPPPGKANGYPPGFHISVDAELGAGSPGIVYLTTAGSTSPYSIACAGTATQFNGASGSVPITTNQGLAIHTDGTNWFPDAHGAHNVPVDQVLGGLVNNQLYVIKGAPWNASGTTGNGESLALQGGSSNATSTGSGGDFDIIAGPDSNDNVNGSARVIQTGNAGISLAAKEGSIVRPCKDVTGTDCQNAIVGANSTGAWRLTVSGTDPGTTGSVGVGILCNGNPAGSPVQIQTEGIFSILSTANGNVCAGNGALVESNCIADQFYEIGTSGMDNGAGDCTYIDSPRRVGIALTAATGSIGSPGRVPIKILPYGGPQQYSTTQALTSATAATTAINNNNGALQMYQVNAAISCRATAAGDTMTLNVLWTDGSSTVQTLSGTALCTTLGSGSWAQITQSVLVASAQNLQWSTTAVTNTHSSTWDVKVSVLAVR